MAVEECSPADDKRVILPDGEMPVTIKLSFEVYSLEEEDRMVSLLAFVGVRLISSVVVSFDGDGATNGDSPTPRT